MLKYLFLFVFLAFSSLLAYSQNEFEITEGDTTYVMKKYYLCYLIRGPERSQDSLLAAQIQEKHQLYLDHLYKAGKLDIAGPMDSDGNLRGIAVLNVASKEEAESLIKQDPAVKAGRLIIEVHPFWAAKGSILR